MERPLREGDVVAAQYLLDTQLSADQSNERWLATRRETGDSVTLSFLDIDDASWQSVTDRVARLQGLLHENILVPTQADADGALKYVAEPFLANHSPLGQTDTFDKWKVIRQLLRAIDYCHSLGIIHGSLQPNHVLIGPSGDIRIVGFVSPTGGVQDYQSPQITSGAQPDTTDDLYSLGQIIFEILAGTTWKPDVELNTPLPNVPAQMLQKMFSANSLDRNTNLSDLLDALALHFERQDQGIQSASFSRAAETPTGSPAPVVTRQADGIPATMVVAALVILLLLGFGVFTLLPDDKVSAPIAQPSIPITQPAESNEQSDAPAAEPVAAPAITPLEAARMEHLKAEGERIGREILKLQIDLEDNGVPLWAGVEYEELTTQLDNADVIYRESRFDEAFTVYEEVLASLQSLIDRIPDELQKQRDAGDAALANGDAEAALTALTIATTLAPNDAALGKKLTRAENLEEVVRITESAEIYERNGDLQRANEQFAAAVEIDELWQPATTGLARTREAITQRNFQRAMSKGFQGIASKNYTAAREGFEAAQRILPSSREPADGLLQVEQSERNDQIERLRKIADRSVAQFDWQTALAAYDDALAISPSLAFAINGKANIEDRVELERSVARFLADPTLLQDDGFYREASRLIREASRLEDSSERFQSQVGTLAQLVSAARIEIPVTIQSNGSTDVIVRKHKQLGLISSETVYLIPGRYTIVGHRPGYRDVREELILLPGQPTPVIVVASDERVR